MFKFAFKKNMATPEDTPNTDPNLDAPAADNAAPASLEEQFAAAQNEIAELKTQLKDQQLRSLAEQDNLRKRNAQDVQSAREFAAKDFAFSLLSVKDTLEMVLKDEQSTTDQIKMGVDMTLKNLANAFERAKVKEVKAEKAKFDPNLHQAMTQIESTTDAPGTVLQVFQKGYTIAERVLRPAMVAVAKAPEAPKAANIDAAQNSDDSSAPPIEPKA
ncbi:MAG: nucleotide exchange factor GrpE [Casimicrobium sp.]